MARRRRRIKGKRIRTKAERKRCMTRLRKAGRSIGVASRKCTLYAKGRRKGRRRRRRRR